jgi:hypothetical protein
MSLRGRLAAFLGAAASLAGCGYIGDPLPPSLNIPIAIEDFHGVQRGDRVLLAFTPSIRATDGLLLRSLGGVDLRAAPVPRENGPVDPGTWEAAAKPIIVADAEVKLMEVSVPVGAWVGQDVAFGVRTISPQGKPSAWSPLLRFRIVQPLPAPAGLTGVPRPHGALLEWQPGPVTAETGWRIFRKAGDTEEFALAGKAAKPEWTETGLQYGQRYTYLVQAFAPGGSVEAEGEMSQPASFLLQDTFPPATPAGITIIAGVKSVELAWERNVEDDLQGYQVYRALGEGPFEKLGVLTSAPSISDAAVESGKKYRYRVSALDTAGNESKSSDPVDIVAP